MSKNLIVFLLLCFAGYYLLTHQNGVDINMQDSSAPAISYDSSLSITKSPLQKDINNSGIRIQAGEYVITPIAEFQVAARVLGAKHYTFDRESSLAPVDLALGWGPMAKDEVLENISISQNNRFYYWRTDNFPIPRREIETNSANMHFIPASPEVEKILKDIEEGDRIKFKGYLVRIHTDDGWRWNSSTTRNDTGNGACEVILVDDISRL